uniref:Polyketide cyclase/dehydrase n=1 Tax=OCS116 cluster bacterium TaxID=2030921 RepID=A0A2A4YPH3_9PROT
MEYIKYHGAVMGFVFGIGFALFASLIFSLTELEFISWAMLAGTPIAVGVFTVLFATPEQARSVKFNAFQPWLSVLGWMLIAAIFAWETLICVVMLLPLYLPLASIGGLAMGYFRHKNLAKSGGKFMSIGLLPLLIIPIEAPYQTPTIYHAELDSIIINAPIEQVWQSLPNIQNIKPDELKWTFSHFIGLPKPQSSIIASVEMGAVRKSSWEKGIYFYERITQIIPNQLLAYDVLVNEQAMKIANLDTHITVGDQYFDIKKGHYKLDDLGGKTRLSISTTYRMTTNVNWYGQLWANFVLDDFHYMVLNLIKDRNEAVANQDNA